MLDFFTSIGQFIATTALVIYNVINGFIQYVLLIPKYYTFFGTTVALMPGIFIPFLLMGTALAVIFVIIGR